MSRPRSFLGDGNRRGRWLRRVLILCSSQGDGPKLHNDTAACRSQISGRSQGQEWKGCFEKEVRKRWYRASIRLKRDRWLLIFCASPRWAAILRVLQFGFGHSGSAASNDGLPSSCETSRNDREAQAGRGCAGLAIPQTMLCHPIGSPEMEGGR
jgi:hypothetical protein